MKTLKTILSTILGILMIPLTLLSIFFGLYNIIPGIKDLVLAETVNTFILSTLGLGSSFPIWLAILIPSITLVIIVLFIVLTWKKNSLFTNLFLHILKWLSTILIVGTPIATIIVKMVEAAKVNEFSTQLIHTLQLQLTSINFIVLAGFIVFYALIKIFGNKITAELNRALTAARTAKELKQTGRTPDIILNLYKMFNFVFPELIVMGMFIALFINTELAIYLYMLLAGLGVFFLISVWIDSNIRREVRRKIKQDEINQLKSFEQIVKKNN